MHTHTRSARKSGAGKQVSRLAAARAPVQLSPEEIAAQEHARTEVARTLRMYGLRVNEHFHPELGEEHTLYVRCRLATAVPDRKLVYAVLENLDWNPDTSRLSTFRDEIDTMRLKHADSAARMAVIVRTPTGDTPRAEAA